MKSEDRIHFNRNFLREKNLNNEIEIWKKIIKLKDNDSKIKLIKKNLNEIKFICEFKNLDNNEKKKFERILKTFAESVFRINSRQYKLEKITDINLSIIKKHVKMILSAPQELQLYFCTEPNRQGVDEEVQINILNEGIEKLNLKAYKSSKHYYIIDGNITKEKSTTSKSIDVIITHKNDALNNLNLNKNIPKILIIGYCKVIITRGGHQDNQVNDAISFIKEGHKYIEKNKNNVMFFVQADGKEAIRNFDKMKKNINNKKRFFVGNSDQIVNWINNDLCIKNIK